MIPASSVLQRNRAVLVVIDVQERLAAAMAARASVVDACALLVEAARIMQIPVVVTRQNPRGLGETELVLEEAFGRAEEAGRLARVDKLAFDAFSEAEFCRAIADTGASQILFAGMETHICVMQSALSGLREAFDVHVAADACCSRRPEDHALALARLGAAGAVVTTAESAVYEAVQRAGTPEFKELLAVVKSRPESRA